MMRSRSDELNLFAVISRYWRNPSLLSERRIKTAPVLGGDRSLERPLRHRGEYQSGIFE